MRLLAEQIIQCLREMDYEATAVRDGHATGLYDYGRHARPELKRPQCEPAWTQRLNVLLRSRGFECDAEVRYPAHDGELTRAKCDLVVESTEGKAWIEIKGAWRSYWNGKGLYLCYLFHPLMDGVDAGKSHTVPLDLKKLEAIDASHARWVCEVVVGFDTSDDAMDGDIEKLEALARFTPPKWARAHERWDDPYRVGHRVNVWAWWREVK